jgi:hypothetical protein
MLIWFIAIFLSCSNDNNTVRNNDIDEFIEKFRDLKFDGLRDISIAQRSKNLGDAVYVVGKGDGSLPVYFVTYNLQKQIITTVDRKNLEKDNIPDYLTKDAIQKAVNAIRENDFFFLAVDSTENVYINPYYANEPPFFLRLKAATGDSVIRRGYVYELYKDKWYLNKTRRKN